MNESLDLYIKTAWFAINGLKTMLELVTTKYEKPKRQPEKEFKQSRVKDEMTNGNHIQFFFFFFFFFFCLL